jgi:uncharacterized membrane protein
MPATFLTLVDSLLPISMKTAKSFILDMSSIDLGSLGILGNSIAIIQNNIFDSS